MMKFYFLDIWIGKQTLKDRHRVKRVAPIVARVAWAAGRALFRSLAKSTPRITRSGGKLTKQFFKKGGFETAKRDFHRFKPANVKQFTGENVSNPKRFNVAAAKSVYYSKHIVKCIFLALAKNGVNFRFQ